MSVSVKAIQFGGCCQGCGAGNDTPTRGAVEIALDRFDFETGMGEMICLACAKRLSKKLNTAIERVVKNQKKGLVYRQDRWQRGSRESDITT